MQDKLTAVKVTTQVPGGGEPATVEEELARFPGPEPGTALRLRRHEGLDGHVRLEQLAHSGSIGWYVQRSFCIPRELLASVGLELRKADCLQPRPCPHLQCAGPLKLVSAVAPEDPPAAPQRRRA